MTKLLLSPDSQLNLIPFAALVDEQNRYLVETLEITYLTSGRDLLRLQSPHSQRQPPLILANPDYNHSSDPTAAQRPSTANDFVARSAIAASRPLLDTRSTFDRRQRSIDLATLQVNPLPGTQQEAAAIAPKLAGALLLTDAQATETALKQVQSPAILHIATHGFFLADTAIAAPTTRGLGVIGSDRPFTPPPAANTENALLRSGLALAGFNRRQSGSEDGVLTALEVTGLDLRGTQLVVLSACETGIGDVANGEGVYGLRRAIVLAGAASQLSSLWRVSDTATKDLMVQYYDRLLANQGRSTSLRQVQLDFLNDPNYQHPFYWAAFIPSGDWRSLPPSR